MLPEKRTCEYKFLTRVVLYSLICCGPNMSVSLPTFLEPVFLPLPSPLGAGCRPSSGHRPGRSSRTDRTTEMAWASHSQSKEKPPPLGVGHHLWSTLLGKKTGLYQGPCFGESPFLWPELSLASSPVLLYLLSAPWHPWHGL